MGAAVSVETAGVPPDVLQLFQECEVMQKQIASNDLKFVQSQSRQMWKNHKKIINTICSKSKAQLGRMTVIDDGKHLPKQLRDMLGGAYGDFIQNLVLPRSDISSTGIRAAVDCIGCDEASLVSFLCVVSPDEMTDLVEKYNSTGAVELPAKIKGKLEKKSDLSSFFQVLFGSKRDPDSIIDPESVNQQAEDIKEMCDDKSQARNKELFELVCYLSRAQCSLINTRLVESHGLTLDALLKKKFKGLICTALSLWTLSRDDAICQSLHDILHNSLEEYDLLSYVVSRYDKMYLQTICTKYESLFKESLIKRIEKVTIGNLKLALVAWISSTAFDEMNEEKIASIIASSGSLSQAMSDADRLKAIRDALMQEKELLSKSLGNSAETGVVLIPEPVQMTLPPIASSKISEAAGIEANSMSAKIIDSLNDKPTPDESDEKKADDKPDEKSNVQNTDLDIKERSDSSAQENSLTEEVPNSTPSQLIAIDTAETSNLPEDSASSPTKIPPLSSQSKRAVSIRGLAVDFDAKYKAASQFLKDEFAQFDKDNSGYLESAEFWNALRSFNLGYTDEEIGAMAGWTDWDCDGHISLSEVINELAESVITMIEGRGEEFLSGLSVIKTRLKKENEELRRLESEGGLSVDLVGYLRDSFEAYDVDENGGLNADEFWKVINVVLCETVNGLKDIEVEELRRKWDADNDGCITWQEALTQFIDIFKGMISDKRDHWIGLVDKESGNLFWYNLRDQNSCWMAEEDQVAYRAGKPVHKKTSLKLSS